MGTDEIVATIERQLRGNASAERAEHEKRYLKSDLDFIGASVPEIRKAAKAVKRERPDLAHGELIEIVDALWTARIHELRMAAVELLDVYDGLLGPGDADLLERLILEARTWALVDGLAASVVGQLLERYPDDLDALVRRWAEHEDFWVRRAALLAHLPGVRSGGGDLERFGQLADDMLDEREFFIRKAIGWVLRETGKRRPEAVVAWLEPRLHRASGVTIREAVKYLPEADRERLAPARRRRA